jgi:hypothetical protein
MTFRFSLQGLFSPILLLVGLSSCSEGSTQADCGWNNTQRQTVVTELGDWKDALAKAAGEPLPAETPHRFEVFAEVTETDIDPASKEMTRFSCVSRQVNVAQNRIGLRFSIFDDQASQDRFIETSSFAAGNDGSRGVRTGMFDPVAAMAEEDTAGVSGADLYCGVGKNGRCSDFLMLRQWSDCSRVVVEAMYGMGNDQDRDEARTVMLAATESAVEYLRVPERGLCQAATVPLSKYGHPTKT